MNKDIIVSIEIDGEIVPVGYLWCHVRKNGKERASFEYHPNWLNHKDRFALEPALSLGKGSFHTEKHAPLFGSLGDSAPDRWGRILMKRAFAQTSKEKEEPVRTLNEIDFLLGVCDFTRQGALRFHYKGEDSFLASNDGRKIPPLVELPKLLNASNRFLDDNEDAEDLRLLLAPGSSLGGARPKASVIDKEGHLCIAKFPRKDDTFHVVQWEAVALTLAGKAGLNIPEWSMETIGDTHIMLLKRFDRNGEQRIPFLSAMSMLNASDNEQRSYLEVAAALIEYGAEPNKDLEELWRRIVFGVLISNTDDHMRNHAFLYENQAGWRLSPVYDVNPTSLEDKPRILSTCIDYDDSTASLDLALSVIKEFRVTPKRAEEIIVEVAQAVAPWKEVAQSFGIKKNEIDRMSSAFCHEDLEKALTF